MTSQCAVVIGGDRTGGLPLLKGMAVEDIANIDNRTANHHGIVEYLNKPHVAQRIAEALRV